MRIALTLLAALGCAALIASCSSGNDTSPPGQTTTATTTATSTSSTGGSGGSAPMCNVSTGTGGSSCVPPGYSTTKTGVVVNTVTADFLDLDGNPAADVVVDVCGFNLCHSGTSDASGHLSVNAKNDSLQVPRMLYGDGIAYVRLQAPLPTTPDAAFGTITTPRLPDAASGSPISPGAESSSGGVTLSLGADAFCSFDIMTYCKGSEQTFRAVQILPHAALAPTLPGLDQSLGIELVFGMAPIGTQICPPAELTVPNSAAWAANATVEFYFQGISLFEEYAPFGAWQKVSEGTVSPDGTKVSTNPGEGIPELGVIGVRLKP